MRYSRQDKLKQIGKGFSKSISSKKIAIIGCGGIGSVLAELLVRGGFNNLVLIDNDIVDETNLQRQIFVERDVSNAKCSALFSRLRAINNSVKLDVVLDILDEKNIDRFCSDVDLILDCTDNFETRVIINDFCETKKKDWIYSGAVKTEVISCLFLGEKKMFNKVFPKNIINESCCEVGVLSSTTFSSASLTYNQVLKYFLDDKEMKLIKLDLWTNKIFEVKV